MESFNNLENKIIRMEDKLDNIEENNVQFRIDNKEQHEEIKKLLDKKADAWVEKAMTWTIALIMTLVISAMVYLVIKR